MLEETHEERIRQIQREFDEAKKAGEQKSGLLFGVLGFIILAVCFFVGAVSLAAIVFGCIAAKKGNTGTKILGIIDILVGSLFLIVTIFTF